ncbi:MAG: tyrosine-type recombinase/integrase [Phycisphaerales bacterium]
MASISNDPNGRRRIQFFDAKGERKTLRLGKVPLRYADAVKVKVEDLSHAATTGHAPADETSRWLANLDVDLYDKLAKAGLVKRRDSATLAGFIDAYIIRRTDVKASTRLVYDRVRRYLVDYFGEHQPLRDISPGDADAWRLNLAEKNLADNTIRRSCGVAKQWFTSAVRSRLITDNPFAGLSASVRANAKRFYYISREQAQAVLDACPDAEWRLLFALARYGGLRVPSEALRLRWQDVDWSNERFTVTSPKTEHHEGHESRLVPIFPELLPYLREVFEQAEPGAVFCITRYQGGAMNLRTQLHRIIKRAGLAPWPKLWQNLRSTRETELADQFPAHVASAWIGNSVAVAVKHYLQVTEDHFRQAAQNAAQKPTETERNDPQVEAAEVVVENVTSAGCEGLREMTTPCMEQGVEGDGRYRTRTYDLTGVINARCLKPSEVY